jgi:hypothetical protein
MICPDGDDSLSHQNAPNGLIEWCQVELVDGNSNGHEIDTACYQPHVFRAFHPVLHAFMANGLSQLI